MGTVWQIRMILKKYVTLIQRKKCAYEWEKKNNMLIDCFQKDVAVLFVIKKSTHTVHNNSSFTRVIFCTWLLYCKYSSNWNKYCKIKLNQIVSLSKHDNDNKRWPKNSTTNCGYCYTWQNGLYGSFAPSLLWFYFTSGPYWWIWEDSIWLEFVDRDEHRTTL